MNRRRLLAGVLGVLALVAGITALGTDLGAPVADALLELLGNDYLVATAVAALGFLLAIPVLLSARASTLDQASMPTPERSLAMPAPGTRFDETLEDRFLVVPYVTADRREAVREELRGTAVDVVAHTSGASRHEAAERVDDGSWTDDETVADFLAMERDGSPDSSLTARLRALARGDSLFQSRARRAARTIVDHADTEGRSR
ncbi:DUF7269 family protein [Haloarchaeobius sp. TZWSO28]|uniref:DUF7269 family protein n=1 Tax=Haloarchaeobius sp. TZWSO28 TaxID=3446119 RepID=UPI003EBD598E